MLVLKVLERGPDRTSPPEYLTRREMTVALGPQQRPEPDVMVVRAESNTGLGQTSFQADDVVLAIEVVSPDSLIRDRERKAQIYARSGIPHFWRLENADNRAVVYVYEIDPATSAYSPTGIHHTHLKLDVPYPIDIDLTEIDRL
jgi:Uma2 family endonuclease